MNGYFLSMLKNIKMNIVNTLAKKTFYVPFVCSHGRVV